MYNKEDFAARYAGLEDFKLLEILDNPENFNEVAIEAAQEELRKRKIKPERVTQYKEQKATDENEAHEKAILPLSLPEKLRFFFLGFVPILNWALRANLKDDGYVLKARQSGHYSMFGIITLVISVIVSLGTSFFTFVMLILWALFFFVVKFFEPKAK